MKQLLGKKAPSFTLPDQNGDEHALTDYAGKWVVLYFYPKDDTPGCTKEACSFRDSYASFKKASVVVLGVSADTVKKHIKFIEKYSLPFTLLADEEKVVVEQYGVFGKKKFMGREYMGIFRSTFLINPKGKIVKIYENVKPDKHAEEILEDIKVLKKERS